jgi:diguanylate cyclase (GGDEF)-like protein
MDDDLDYELARTARYGNSLTFVLLDLDNFKRFNDTHGHQEGDEVLRSVGRILTSALRRTDSAYRYGGDELSILLRETPGDAGARLSDRLRQRIAEHFAAELPPITASFGVADASDAGTDEELIRMADANLYEAKRRGSNQVVHGIPRDDEGQGNVRAIRPRG